jgi:predicted DCC family thiol-disulfide oxidoreductase YuxK
VSKQMKDINEIKLLDSEIYLCNQIKDLLKKRDRRNRYSKRHYTEHEVLQIALNRLMSELISRQ